ncbi:MAG: HAD-IA family hydrolase [Patescibacteria group bacterium]
MNKIKNLIFDIGGVLIFQSESCLDVNDHALKLVPGTTKIIVDDCFKQRTVDGNFNEKEYFMEMYSNLINWEKYQNIVSHLLSKEELNKDLVDWIDKNKGNNFRVYALSNNTIALNDVLRKKFKLKVFDRIFSSAEIGLVKPDPKLFKYVLDEISANPEDCLFIDNTEQHIKAANALGFKGILFKNNRDFFSKIDSFNIL